MNIPEKITQWCSYEPAPIHPKKTYSYNQMVDLLIQKFCEMTDYVTNFSSTLNIAISTLFNDKEDKSHLTFSRKLSENGNFTGSLNGENVVLTLSHIADNTGDIAYLTQQFSDGQTGFVIDCGFFEDSEIKKYYDGGVF